MRNRILKITQVAIAGLGLIALGTANAQRADNNYTAAGTDIDNIATVNYQLGGVAQDVIESDPNGNATPGAGNGNATVFDVDRIIDLDVFTDSVTLVTPGEDGVAAGSANPRTVLTYVVTNLGNDIQDYDLTVINGNLNDDEDVDGLNGNEGADVFDVVNFRIYEDANGDGLLDGGDTLLTAGDEFLDEVAPGAANARTVFIVSEIPLTDGTDPLVNGDVAYVTLAAQTHDGGAAGQGALTAENDGALDSDDGTGAGGGVAPNEVADGAAAGDETNIDTVFGDPIDLNSNNVGDDVIDGTPDAAQDARAADTAAYVIVQLLSVQKESAVIRDPFNGTTNPKRIPGAVIEYTITVTNNAATGGSTAEQVVITDNIPANTTYIADGVNGGVAGDDPTGTINPGGTNVGVNFATGTVTSDATDLAPGEELVVTFRITIN